METLNLGILAHVDAGKTTLTERLLHAAGVIDEVGRVDDGSTQTDSLALERQRGITIKSAVVSFVVDGVTVNVLDTPGHPDFIAEVERVLGVLDAAVLVVSAVEGVQSQTMLLFRALRRLGVPTLVFVNKIDRVGADVARTVAAIAERLDVEVLTMVTPSNVGTSDADIRVDDLADGVFAERASETLSTHDDAILRRYLDAGPLPPDALQQAIGEQAARLQIVPVYAGAALRGIGVDELMRAITTVLPARPSSPTVASEPPSGTVFKIERSPSGDRLAYVRMFAGILRARDRLRLDAERDPETVTAIEVFERGTTRQRAATQAGEIAKVHGLSSARVGDSFGPATHRGSQRTFPPPALETAVVARHRNEARAVFEALTELAEQDPLINLRQDDARQELFLSLYGEVQKEIVAQTLALDHGLQIEFRPTTPVCIERPNRPGSAIERLPRHRSPNHPFLATVGLTIAPTPPGSGVTFELGVGVKSVPIHVFDSIDNFRALMQRTVEDTLREGLCGWQVADCHVVMTECGYQAPPRKWPGTTSWDYRLLTPLVLMTALRRAGTTVLEPIVELHLEIPAGDLSAVMSVLHALDARPGPPTTRGAVVVLGGTIRVAQLHDLQSRLPDLTRGEGVLETAPAGHRPVRGVPPPSRPRTDRNPLDRDGYLRSVARGSRAGEPARQPFI
ncbi:MAG: TetM/TetW/TetO/TetS family tetracycline resistance ribosomal protection protein [Ilumatobacteraceae bacterium]